MANTMGMRQGFKVTLADGRELKAQTDLRDTRRWERDHKRGWFDTDRPSVEAMAYRCWSALTRQGDYVGDWQSFDDAIVELELLEDEAGAVDPTDGTPGDE